MIISLVLFINILKKGLKFNPYVHFINFLLCMLSSFAGTKKVKRTILNFRPFLRRMKNAALSALDSTSPSITTFSSNNSGYSLVIFGFLKRILLCIEFSAMKVVKLKILFMLIG